MSNNSIKVETKVRKKSFFEKLIILLKLEKYKDKIREGKDFVVVLIYAIILALIVRSFFYENFKIPSGSMNPILLKGDRVLVNKFYYGYTKFSFPFNIVPIKERILANRKPKRGDIVVFKLPSQEDFSTFYIKRVVGLPNDKIQVKQGRVFVNGNVLSYKKVDLLPAKSENNHNYFPSMRYKENNGEYIYDILISDINSISGNTEEYIIPEGYYLMMGDNRDNSHDSRFSDFGFIPFKNIVGRAEMISFSTANGKFNFGRLFKSIKAQEG